MKMFVAVLVLGAISTLLILGTQLVGLQVLAGLFLFCFAPGFLLIEILLPAVNIVERAVLSVGGSFALSTLTVYALQFLPGHPTSTQVILSLDLLIIGLLLFRAFAPGSSRPCATDEKVSKRLWIYLILVIGLASLFRFAHLGFSEFQGDEIDITVAAQRTLLGETEALFTSMRGPAQTLVTAAFFLFTGKFQEWIPRMPVALASLMTVVTVFLLGWRMFNLRVGLLAGLFLSIEGFVLAYGRIVQMQSTLIFMMALSVLCYYHFVQTDDQALSVRYQVLGSLFFALGLLSHQEMAVMIPVLAFLYFVKYGRRFWKENTGGLVILVTLILLVSGSFYLPFLLNPQFSETFGYYSGSIVGRGVTNNLRQFALVGTFYNSTYYLACLLLLIAWSWGRNLRSVISSVPFSGVLAGLISAGSLAVAILPVLTAQSSPWPGLILFTLLAAALVGTSRVSLEYRVLFLWFFVFFIPYSFYLKELHVHYYVYFLPWTILAATSLEELYRGGAVRLQRLGAVWPQVYRGIGVTLFSLLYGLCGYYAWLVFLRPTPEYALTYPQYRHPFYLTLYDERHGEAFGFPQKSGWKTISYLYQTGALRGAYETNELYQKAQWYTRRQFRDADPPRYYFLAETPHRLQAGPWPAPFEPAAYHLIGTVMVGGLPRLRLYEHNAFSSSHEVVTYQSEDYEARYDALRSLRDDLFAKKFQADDGFFRDVAHYLEAVGQEGDGLILEAPEQVGILSYYYQGGLPYYPVPSQSVVDSMSTEEVLKDAVTRHRRLYTLLWAVEDRDPQHWVESWLNDHLFEAGDRWFGNLRLLLYAVPQSPPSLEIQNPTMVRLGDSITFLGHNLTTRNVEAGDILQLTLFWQATGAVDQRYKVFVHLLDQNEQIVGQRDSEPGGGLRPTTQWPMGEVMRDNYGVATAPKTPPGSYSIEVGMYDLETGDRLPAFDERGQRLPGDRILLGPVQVRKRP